MRLLHIIFSIWYALLSVIVLTELWDLWQNPETYERVYDLGPGNPHWSLQSVRNFILFHVLFDGILYAILGFTAWRIAYGKARRWVIGVFWGITILLTMNYLRSYYLYVESGYDHYPGWDPYWW
jgi:hypothetical protein